MSRILEPYPQRFLHTSGCPADSFNKRVKTDLIPCKHFLLRIQSPAEQTSFLRCEMTVPKCIALTLFSCNKNIPQYWPSKIWLVFVFQYGDFGGGAQQKEQKLGPNPCRRKGRSTSYQSALSPLFMERKCCLHDLRLTCCCYVDHPQMLTWVLLL